jgi:hypothetical protein
MNKYTPGPWCIVDIQEDGEGRFRIQSEHDYPVASTEPGNVDAVSNALLIAAGPDLLEVCQRALRELKDGETTAGLEEDLAAAIAKAEGRE